MRYAQLKAFDAVARLLSFSKAADRLGITQPAVTLQIKALEEENDVSLFLRQGGGVSLTAAGLALFDHTSRMFAVEEEIREFLTDRRNLSAGELVLGADGPHVALDLIARFKMLYPGIHVKLELGNARSVWRDVTESRVEAAIMANPPTDDRVTVQPLLRSGMMAIMPLDHPLAEGGDVGLADFAASFLIAREQGSNTRRVLEAAMKSGGYGFDPAMELGSREAVREAVAVGMGVGCVYARETVGDSRIAARPIRELTNSNLDTLVFLSRNSNRRVIRSLQDCAKGLSIDLGKNDE
ncbi:LysR substrate-binding domain-containing protein [Aestuariispira insulae]|uniref:Aminoethylphosphonate catabolism LysR family transcriptional regulator n=1 Tax=Aestuariispira insulae TaxID=1461337 RepID=A0A3D9HVL0_9PROT|nr:LysR substrate-binding domain-containing protein [Aestuariispira insulae]RED53421.1 aminoethylphosphonate catabolism LysR family transcriptional regulator [Aestuariispira insulae]